MTKHLKPIMRKVNKASEEEIEKIIQNIIRDICYRRGIGSEWEQIDDDIQEEIKDEWRLIIKEVLNDN